MIFTDDDLKWLKKWWKKEFGEGWLCQECGINQHFDIPSLLSRLDAAEKILSLAFRYQYDDGLTMYVLNFSTTEIAELMDAWRKVRGK